MNVSSSSAAPTHLNASESALKIWGGTPLSGHVRVSGAKNSALVIMAGTLLCPEPCRLSNVPSLVDVARMGQMLSALGVRVERNGDVLDIDASHLHSATAPYEVVSKLRASFFAIGPLLARYGSAQIPMPGGCAIGTRPVDLHVRGLQQLGAHVRIEHGIVYASLAGRNCRLKGARIYLDYPSVGATETLLMAATLAEGETIIENAAQEPEVIDLANFCRSMGARIRGAGTKEIAIVGTPRLHGTEYAIVPDRIEAGTLLIAGAIARSEISLSPVVPEHLSPVIAKLQEVGPQVVRDAEDCLRVLPAELHATDIETLPYPGFPTDMQAQFTALLALAEGDSVVTETVFENRMGHVAELARMGADMRVRGRHALIRGVPTLTGAPVMATDLRASAALVLAGLAAKDVTIVQGLHHLDRGYEHLDGKLRKLGARMERMAMAADEVVAAVPAS
ncbi:UDP-N-acetylglucosamine 1-carboxyvinyltransferase [Rubidibacter lacunae KORDI 51-2]|uniref:UDP-N-acetylglucosamine 1-carboxyvinyltransferase n=1 Tax=Rubidibacter lacunae KORDI 51-2 TaxID=582515 RepID=U5DNN8_9CHRO|nr:UDP-N-acetylglucosamine 1-carboxyvinyltransferase [Rubidibacter lacunae]ERN42482.1 UDP-N-acetylglucosamine 1-carboxyvinyltransferase [Rubidibacter lacunae KORDI 51-2]